jgi:hypothetical protein
MYRRVAELKLDPALNRASPICVHISMRIIGCKLKDIQTALKTGAGDSGEIAWPDNASKKP